MTIGPVQLLVLGLNNPEFDSGIMAELQLLHDGSAVDVIDAVVVFKDYSGHVSRLGSGPSGSGSGAVASALVGLDSNIEHEPAEASDEPVWDVLSDIPGNSAAMLVLLEHHWAVPLRDAVARAGAFRLASEFVSPLDLADIGLLSTEEAAALVAADRDSI